jgi:hypothetical protein
MINFVIISVGAVDDACADDGLVGEGGRAMGLSISDIYGRQAHRLDEK